MNRIYRLVWDHLTGSYKVVGELARSHGKNIVSGTVSGTLLITSVPLYAADQAKITVASGNTQVFQAPNGVQEIDIATANQAGVSHNRYNDYNVSRSGLILNNNSPLTRAGALQSQLGGQIVPNQNLSNEANLIINEVVSSNRSSLLGYTEIVGGKADLVVANPYGITCDSCGFINTDRVSLTTGSTVMDANGRLQGFNVNRGDIAITGKGLNATAQQVLDLVAGNLYLDGQINGQDIKIIAGNNGFNYLTRRVDSHNEAPKSPIKYAIDSTALGGMYANRIELVATNVGVGVHMLGDVAASASDFTLTASGKIEMVNNHISAKNDIKIMSDAHGIASQGGIELAGDTTTNLSMSAENNVELTGQNGSAITIENGQITAENDLKVTAEQLHDHSEVAPENARRFAQHNTTITTSNSTTIESAQWGVGNQMRVEAGSIELTQAELYSGSRQDAEDKDLSLTAHQGDLTINSSKVTSTDVFTATAAAGSVRIDANGKIESSKDMAIHARDEINTAGQIIGGASTTIGATDGRVDLNNSGTLQTQDALQLGEASHDLNVTNTETGQILANQVDIVSGNDVNSGLIQANNGMTISAESLSNNASGKLLLSTVAGRDGQITVSGDMNNAGHIQSAGDLTVDVGGSTTNQGSLLTQRAPDGGNGAIQLITDTLDNSGTIDSASSLKIETQSETNTVALTNSGYLQAVNATELNVAGGLINSGQLMAGDDVSVHSNQDGFTLTNSGLIESQTGNVTLGDNQHRTHLTNETYNESLKKGAILAHRSFVLQADAAINRGVIQSMEQGQITATSFQNLGKNATLLLGKNDNANALINLSNLLNNEGTIQTSGELLIRSDNAVRNTGIMVTETDHKQVSITASTFDNQGFVESAGTLTVNTTDSGDNSLTNSGQLHSEETMTLRSAGVMTNQSTGVIEGEQTTNLTQDQWHNQGDVISHGALIIDTKGELTNAGNVVTTGDNHHVDITATAVSNQGNVDSAGSLTVKTTDTSDHSLVTTGQIHSTQNMLLSSAGAMTNSGTIVSDQDLTFTNSLFTNLGNIGSMGLFTLTTQNHAENRGNLLTTGEHQAMVITAATLDNQGYVETSGSLTVETSDSGNQSLINSGQMYAQDAFSLTAKGRVTNQADSSLLSERDMVVTGQSIDNAGEMGASGSLRVTVERELNTQGVIATVGNDGVQGNQKLTLTANTINNQGTVDSAGTLTVSALNEGEQALINGGEIHSQEELSLTSKGALINQTAGSVWSENSLHMMSSSVTNQGDVFANQEMTVAAVDHLENRGTMATQGEDGINGNQQLTLTATSLDNQGFLDSAGQLSVTTTATGDNALVNQGQIHSQEALTLRTDGKLHNKSAQSKLVSEQSATITAASVHNEGGIGAEQTLTVQSAGEVANSGTINGHADVTIDSQASMTNLGSIYAQDTLLIKNLLAFMNHQEGSISSGNDLDIQSHGDVTNSGTVTSNANIHIDGKQKLTNNGLIYADGQVHLDSLLAWVNNLGAQIGAGDLLKITSNSSFTNAGTISSSAQDTNTEITSKEAINNTGVIYSDGGLIVESTNAELQNSGDISSAKALTLTAQGNLTNTKNIIGNQSIHLDSQGEISNSGTVYSDAAMHIHSQQSLINQGSITSWDQLTINSASAFSNAENAEVIAQNGLSVESERIDNKGDLLSKTALSIHTSGGITNHNLIQSGSALSLESTGDIVNANNGEIRSNRSLKIKTSTDQTHTVANIRNESLGVIAAQETLTLESADDLSNQGILSALGNLTLSALTSLSNSGKVVTDSNLVIGASGSITNDNLLHSMGTTTLKSDGSILNTANGKVNADQSLNITSSSKLANQGDMQSLDSVTMTASDGQLENTGSVIAKNKVDLTAQQDLRNSGKIESGQSQTVLSKTGSIDNSDGLIVADGSLVLKANNSIVNAKTTNDSKDGFISGNGVELTSANLQNSAHIQSKANLDIHSAQTISNEGDGKLLANNTLNISMSNANAAVQNSGTIQSGDALNVSLADQKANWNNQQNGVIFAGTDLRMNTLTLNNQGKIYGTHSTILNTDALVNGSESNSTALIFGAQNLNQTILSQIQASGLLTNFGAIHSNSALRVSGKGITNTNTAGMSSQSDLTVTSTGLETLDNNGALYSGTALNLDAIGGKIINRSGTGTLDSSGSITTTSDSFVNNNHVVANGAINISTTSSFINETVASDGKSIQKQTSGAQNIAEQPQDHFASEHGGTKGSNRYFKTVFFEKTESLSSEDRETLNSRTNAQIMSLGTSGQVTVNFGAGSGLNKIALISAPSVTLNGTGTFTNESFALYKTYYKAHWIALDDNHGTSKTKMHWACIDGRWNCEFNHGNSDSSRNSFNPQLPREGGLRDWSDNLGNKDGPAMDAAIRTGGIIREAVVLESFGSGIYAKNGDSTGVFTFNGKDENGTLKGVFNNVGTAWSAEQLTAENLNTQVGNNPGSSVTKKAESFRDNNDQIDQGLAQRATADKTSTDKTTGSYIVEKEELNGNTRVSGVVTEVAVATSNVDVSEEAGSATLSGGKKSISVKVNSSNATKAKAVNKAGQVSGGSFNHTPVEAAVVFGDLDLSLPSNPNGYYVQTRNPTADYLVESNPLFAVGSNYVGSEYLAERYGYNPDDEIKRLGDKSYETYLVREQLIKETGVNRLNGFADEASQMQGLMDNALSEASKGQFVYGQPLTDAQVANLDHDIVWMVTTIVDGQEVLVPKVYLSEETIASIQSGAVVSGDNVNMMAGSVTNTGGTIASKNALIIETEGDITNTSGNITGGSVSLESHNGSVVNETFVQATGNDSRFDTVFGKRAGITSTGDMSVNVGKDIKVIGAEVTAGGNASLKAGHDIVVDTIVDKQTRTSSTSSGSGLSKSETTVRKSTERHVGSGINIGGKLTTDSGNNTVIGGSSLNAKSGWDGKSGGKISIESRQDKTDVTVKTSKSGFGVGGGLYGTQSTTTNDFEGKNVGSNINVGDGNNKADLNLNAGTKVVVQGSDVNATGNGNIHGEQGIDILDGLDEKRHSSRTETTTFGKFSSNSDTKASASAGASAGASATHNDTSAEAQASAKAGAKAEAGAESHQSFSLMEHSVTEEYSGSDTGVSSNLNFGGDANLSSNGDVNIQGSNVSAENINVDADNVNVKAGRNTSWSSSSSQTDSIGIYQDSSADASAKASAKASAQASAGMIGNKASASADASANANAQASSTTTLGARHETSDSSSFDQTHTNSTLNARGNLSVTTKHDQTYEGADVSSGGDMTMKGENITNKAVKDIHQESSNSSSQTVGLYLSADAEANADANANVSVGTDGQMPSAEATANASVEAEAGVGVRMHDEGESSSAGSTTYTGNTFRAGGNVTRDATNHITDQATEIEAGGNIDQHSKTYTDQAVVDTSTSNDSSHESELRVGMYADASAEVSAGASSSGGGENEQGADVSGGVKVSMQAESESESNRSTDAHSSRFKSGGNTSLNTEDKMELQGTTIESDGDVSIDTGSLDYQAIHSTETSSKDESSAEMDLKVGVDIKEKPVLKFGAEAETENGDESSRTSQGGSIKGNNISINTHSGDANLEATDIEANGDISLHAAGSVNMTSAEDSSTETSVGANASASFEFKDKEVEAEGEAGTSFERSHSNEANTGSMKGNTITISAGNNVTSEGTQMESADDTSIKAGGSINLNAANSSSNSESAEVHGGANTDGEIDFGVGGRVDVSAEATSTSIKSGGKVTLDAQTIVNQEADISSEKGTEMKGNVRNERTTNYDISVGASIGSDAPDDDDDEF